MNFHRESRKESYDVVVVGAGMGGLSAAALLAKAGNSVLLVERHDRPGGYAHSFKRKNYTFDSGVHLISGCRETGFRGGQAIYRMLEVLQIRDKIDFVSVDPYTRAVFPDLVIEIPQTLEAFVQAYVGRFPQEEEGIRKLVEISLRLAEEAAAAHEVIAGGEPVGDKLSHLFRYRRTTLRDVLDQLLRDDCLKGTLAALWPYLGLPPSRLSFLYWSIMLVGYTVDGAFYCKGSFQKFADVLAEALEDSGGEVFYRMGVRRIEVDNNEVRGIVLENGQRINAPVVVSNVDAYQTVYSLVGSEHFPSSYLRKLKNLDVSISAFVVYLATDLDLKAFGIAHESFLYASFDHDENYEQSLAGEVTWIGVTLPTLIDPSLAPDGEHLVMLTTLLPYDVGKSWRDAKEHYTQAMVEIAGRYIQGLEEHILFLDAGSPRTMERYTLNALGSAYGWEVSPGQVAPGRMGNKSPITGLFFSGHWAEPGAGIYAVCVSGTRTAQSVMNLGSEDDLWRAVSGLGQR